MEPSAVAELDTGEAPFVLTLATTGSSTTTPVSNLTRSEIFVRRQVWSRDAKVLVIVERRTSEGIIHESHKYLDLQQDLVLPVYVIPRLNRTEWNVEVAYGKGTVRVDYPFQTRADTFRFQKLLTGYKPVEAYDDIACFVTYKGWKLRQPQYTGRGGIQLWVDSEQTPTTSPASSRSSQSSHNTARPSIASIESTSTLVQTHAEKSVLVLQDPRPPLLVAFLKDKADEEGYTMLKINSICFPSSQTGGTADTAPVTHLIQSDVTSRKEEALLSIVSGSSRKPTFRVDKHLPSKGSVPLSSWNLCERSLSSKDKVLIEPLDCTHLALNFASVKDPLNLAKRASLDKAMLQLQAGHMTTLSELNEFRKKEIRQTSQAMRAQPPSMTSPFVSSGTTNSLDRSALPVYELQPWISTTFISAPWGSPEFGRGAVTSELETVSPVSQRTAISPSSHVSPTFELDSMSPKRSRVEAS